MTYQNKWTFNGFTQKSSDTQGLVPATSRDAPNPDEDSYDTFPTQAVINTTTTALLSNIQDQLRTQLAKAGIQLINVSKIEPTVTVIVSKDRYAAPSNLYEVIWHHSLSIVANVYFETDKPLIQSPIAPALLAALVAVIEYLIVITAAALVLYAIAETFIKSFFTQTQTVQTYDPSTGKTTTETLTTPSWLGQIVTVIGVLAGLGIGGYLLIKYLGQRKSGKRR